MSDQPEDFSGGGGKSSGGGLAVSQQSGREWVAMDAAFSFFPGTDHTDASNGRPMAAEFARAWLP